MNEGARVAGSASSKGVREWALDERGRLSGRVGFDNLVAVRELGEARIRELTGERIEFDLSGLDEANSAAVVLLIAWQRAAAKAGKSITCRGASAGLRNIAAFSGVTEILALEPGGRSRTP